MIRPRVRHPFEGSARFQLSTRPLRSTTSISNVIIIKQHGLRRHGFQTRLSLVFFFLFFLSFTSPPSKTQVNS
ncbi:hypothetical protein GE21DRAFT_1113796 [Neurospora crassa]|nr:hypothetical protein GE21DRAFT_1113796 [Neurospora crassa]